MKTTPGQFHPSVPPSIREAFFNGTPKKRAEFFKLHPEHLGMKTKQSWDDFQTFCINRVNSIINQ